MINAQNLIDGLDKTTVDGFAQALLISISNLRDEQGNLLWVRLSHNPIENIRFAKDIARMMLKAS
jgi:hypothetical protein